MQDDTYLLSFLESTNPIAAENAKKVEELVFKDAKGALLRGRIFAEEIIKDVLKKENIEVQNLTTNYDRIIFLSREGILTREIQQCLDTIRIAGNKAAHEASFDDILEAIKVFKMMYKLAVWYVEVYSINDVKIPPYRNPNLQQQGTIGIDKRDLADIVNEAIKGQISQMIQFKSFIMEGKNSSLNNGEPDTENEKGENVDGNSGTKYILENDLPDGKSYLHRELKRLQESSQEAVESPDSLSKFKEYMHVERKIQKDFESILEKAQSNEGPQLILLCGSVGDGKSHLLAYLKEKKPQLLENFRILNDATESFSPNKNAIETLSELLEGFSDQRLHFSNDRIILAINLGVLHNFISTDHDNKTFHSLTSFIDDSQLFSQNVTTKYSKDVFHLIGFSDYQPYELTNQGAESSFYSGIFSKVFSRDERNPFYIAYKKDLERNVRGVIHENFEFLMNPDVQNQIIQLIIYAIIKNKLVISARAFYNFIADLIIPESYTEQEDLLQGTFEKLEQTVPSLLFKKRERSIILKAMAELDPIHVRSPLIDQILIDLNTLNDWGKVVDKHVNDSSARRWLDPLKDQKELTDSSLYEFSQILIRLTFLVNKEFFEKLLNPSFKKYLRYLYYFNKATKQHIRPLYEEVKSSIFRWRGSPKKGYIYINKPSERFRIAQYIDIKPSIDHLISNPDEVLSSFKQVLHLAFHGGNIEDRVYLEIDFPLYELLLKVQNGYCPNKKDEEDAIKFIEFLDQIMKFGKRDEELLVHIPQENKLYKLSIDDFGSFVFERE